MNTFELPENILLYLLQENYPFALQEVLSVQDQGSEYLFRKKSFYLGISEFQSNHFDEARTHLLASVPSEDNTMWESIQQLFDSYHLQRPNPRIAKTLSLFIPGRRFN